MIRRPYRWAIPLEVVPTIDQLKAQGFTARKIATHLGVHWRTIGSVIHRRAAYKDIPKCQKPNSKKN